MTITADDLGLLPIREAAQTVGVARTTVYAWIARYGITTARDAAGRLLVSELDVYDAELRTRRQTRGRRRWLDVVA